MNLFSKDTFLLLYIFITSNQYHFLPVTAFVIHSSLQLSDFRSTQHTQYSFFCKSRIPYVYEKMKNCLKKGFKYELWVYNETMYKQVVSSLDDVYFDHYEFGNIVIKTIQ